MAQDLAALKQKRDELKKNLVSSQESLNALDVEIERLEKVKVGPKFAPEYGQRYYYVNTGGYAGNTNNWGTTADDKLINFYNAFPDEATANRRLEQARLFFKAKAIEEYVNKGWEPQWGSSAPRNYYWVYDHSIGIDTVLAGRCVQYGCLVFKSKEVAEDFRRLMDEDGKGDFEKWLKM